MANWSTLKTAIAAVIKTNGNKEITGQILQNTLNTIVSSLGEKYQFVGIATPTTVPGTPDGNVFHLATEAGTYANFGGLVLDGSSIYVLTWNGTWSALKLTGDTIANSLSINNIFKPNQTGAPSAILLRRNTVKKYLLFAVFAKLK